MLAGTVARRSRLPRAVAEMVAVTASLAPAMMALRGSQVAGYHGAEHKAIGGYEQDSDAIDVAKEHERCGSHMVGPMLVATAVGGTIVARMPASKRGPARMVSSMAAVGLAAESFSWMTRHPEHPLARALARPGFELQRVAATREPTARRARGRQDRARRGAAPRSRIKGSATFCASVTLVATLERLPMHKRWLTPSLPRL